MKKLILPFKQEVSVQDIIYLESDSNYTRIYTKGKSRSIITAKSLCHVLTGLDQQEFIRINRSQAINSSYIRIVKKAPQFATVTLRNGVILKTSRRRMETLLQEV